MSDHTPEQIRAMERAAPQLYEALCVMVATYPYSPPCHGWEHQVRAHQMASAALRKAEEA